jgi:hypothetical protein
MRFSRIFAIALFMCIAGFAALPTQEAQAAPVAASSLGVQVSPTSLAPTRVWYYYRRHYWHRHYWHRHYWHRHYWHRRYYRRYYW